MQAVILAGGKGRRLYPHTYETPKPLVTVAGKPVIEILLQQMKKHAVKDVIIAVNHMADKIEQLLQDGSRLGIPIRYSKEEQELSTVAPLKLIDELKDTFIVANGDILTDLNFETLMHHHLQYNAPVTVAVNRRLNKIDYGVLETGKNGMVTSFVEKPASEYLVSCGIYVFSKKVLDIVPDDKPFGFDHLMLKLLEQNIAVNTYLFNGFWLDIGRPEDYEKAQDEYPRHFKS